MKRNFVFTKKAISQYLGISRNTLVKRLNLAQVDNRQMEDILDWLIFEGMGIGRMGVFLKRYIKGKKPYQCEDCGVKKDLQMHHIEPRSLKPEQCFIASNIKILCLKCHAKADVAAGLSGVRNDRNNHLVLKPW